MATHFKPLIKPLALLLLVGATSTFAQTNLSINAQVEKQTIDGFGASDAWAVNPMIKKWISENNTTSITNVADLLFSTDKGIGLSVWRFNIGAGSSEQGSNSKIPDSIRRSELFASSATAPIDTTKHQGQVRLLKEAHSRGVTNFVAFANSPPTWATKNGLAHPGDGTGIGSTNLKADQVNNFSAFLVKVVKYLRNTVGVPVNNISPINEPTWDWQGQTQEGNRYNNDDIKTVYRSLYSELQTQGLSSSVKIDGAEVVEYTAALSDSYKMQFDGSTYTGGMNGKGYGIYKNYIDTFLGDTEMRTILGNKISLHGYFSEASSARLGSLRDKVLQNVNAVSPGAKIWMSELSILGGAEDIRTFDGHGWNVDDMDYALHIGKTLHRDLSRMNASSWQWWTAITPYDYKDGLLKINSSLDASSVQSSKVLWTLGNFSRFIRPNYKRVDLPNVDNLSGVMASAYKSPDNAKLVVVVVNASYNNEPVKFSIAGLTNTISAFSTYTTNANHNLAATGSVTASATYTVPARSTVTFVGNAGPTDHNVVADFSASSATVYAGDPVTFTSTSTNNPTSFLWTINGGTPTSSTASSVTVTFAAAGTFAVSLKASNATSSNTVQKNITVLPKPAQEVLCSNAGMITRKVWTGIPRTGTASVDESVSSIPQASTPTANDTLTSFEAPINVGDDYGTVISGYVCAPYTGNYTFWIAGDNNAELWLSSDESPANKLLIASVTGWTNSREWTKYSSQVSATKALVAGKRYYIQVLHKESTGGDNVAVRWQTPAADTGAPISGAYLLQDDTVTTPPSSGNALPASGQSAVYKIVSNLSSKLLEVPGSSTSTGTATQQWADVNGANQRWTITARSDGTYTVKNVNSSLCLDVSGASTSNGASLIQWTCSNALNQTWKFRSVGTNLYELVSGSSNLCADISGASTADGAKAIQWACSGGNNQRWSLIKIN